MTGRAGGGSNPISRPALHTAHCPGVARRQTMVPEFDLSLWPTFAHLAERARANRVRPGVPGAAPPRAARALES